MSLLTAAEAWNHVVSDIRGDLGQVQDDDTDAIIAGLLRRAAAVRCPCPRPALVDALTDSLGALAPREFATRDNIDQILDDLIAAGDLIEISVQNGRPIIYLGPPRFVTRKSSVMIMGGYADVGLPIPSELEPRLTSRRTYRFLRVTNSDEATPSLTALGFFPYPMDVWTASPAANTPGDLVGMLDERLESSGRSGDIPELLILDWAASTSNYRGRWVTPKAHSGRYVARRPQKWGAPLWCYVELDRGKAVRLVDLPSIDRRFRACDETWWVQFALDAVHGRPQEISVGSSAEGRRSLSVRMPVPMWAQRRLLLVGELLPRSERGFLFSYSILAEEVEDEIAFLRKHLWCETEPS